MPSDVTAPKARPPLLEYGLLLALATIWGSSFTFLKISVISIPPITAAAMRALLACVLLYAILRVQGGRLPRDLATWRSFGALAAVNTLFPFILIAWGIQWVDASLTVILNSTTPIFAFLITWGITRHEAATARRLFGLMVGLLGIVLIVGATALSGLGTQIVPQLSIVLGSLSYAASAIYGPRFRQMGPLLPAIASLLLSSLVLIPLAAVVERPWTATPTLQSLGALLAVGLLGTALGNVLYFRLLGTLGTISTTSQAYLRVPIGVLVSVLVLGETLSSSGVLGLICVVVGVAAMTIPKGAMVPMLTAVRTRFGQHFHLLPDYLLLLVLAVLWAGSYIWVKIGLASIPPLTLMLGRISVAALFLLMVLKVRGLSLPRDPLVWRRLAIQGVFTTVIPFSLVAWGQQWVDAGAAAILNSLAPMFVFLITWGVTRHEPANPLKLFGVMAGLSGVVVVIGPEALFGMGSEIIPPIALVVASLSYGLGAINSRHFRGSNPVVSATGAMLCAALILLPFALVIERPWTVSPTWSALGAMLAVGVLSTGCGFLIYFRLARTIGSLGVSTQSYLRAPIGVVLGALVLGETITSPLIAGMLLVVIGVGAMTMPAGSVVAGASKRA